MELIGSLFLILALVVVVALFIGRPFFLQTEQEAAIGRRSAEHEISALLAERDRVLNALQELDFDYSLGKIPAEEYPEQRAVLLKSGADVLRRLDEMAPAGGVLGAGTQVSAVDNTVEDRIEAAVAARRADSAQTAGAQSFAATSGLGQKESVAKVEPAAAGMNGGTKEKDALEEMIAQRKRQRKESAAGFCPRCGKPVQKSDRFCSKCGATLSV